VDAELEELGRSIKRAQDRDHRRLDAALQRIGITLVQWDALRAIDERDGASAHELAVASFQSDQAFGTLAGRLESAGWVARAPGYGRRIEHRLTNVGRRVLAEGHDVVATELATAFAPLDAAERAELLRLLRKLVQ
jgi:DNA-binding MarR family transcriptional regulator